MSSSRLVVALDNLTAEEAQNIATSISLECGEYVGDVILKVNDLLGDIGLQGIGNTFENHNFKLMIDGKWHDIGETIVNYLRKLAANEQLRDKVEYITIHASNGVPGLKKFMFEKNEVLKLHNLKVLGISALTTLKDADTERIFDETSKHAVLKLAKEAIEGGLDGLVCSPLEAEAVRAVFGDRLILVTPGVRFADVQVAGDDQERVNNPANTIKSGSNDIVMGRPIVQAKPIRNALKRFFDEIQGVVPEIDLKKYEFEKILYTGNWEELLKFIGAFYIRPEGGKYCRLASKLLSNAYVNIGAVERNYLVLERAAREIAGQLLKLPSGEKDKDNKDIPLISEKAEQRKDIVIMGAQMGSVRLSGYIGEKLGVEMSIYTEKTNPYKKIVEAMKSVVNGIANVFGLDAKILEVLNFSTDEDMELARHDVDLSGKKVVLNEDIITKGTTLKKMIEIVEKRGGEVIAITCVGNRYGKDTYEYNGKTYPILSCYVPPKFEMYFDDATPLHERKDYPRLPEGAQISEKPKANWKELVMSMMK